MTARSRLIWVAALLSTYVIDGKSFGPSEVPIQVPEALAVALGLGEFEGPVDGDASTAAPTDTSDLQGQVDSLTTERDDLRQGINARSGEVLALTTERDDLKRELDELKANAPEAAPSALPADARERLIEINGIGEKLADKVLEVLGAPVEPASE